MPTPHRVYSLLHPRVWKQTQAFLAGSNLILLLGCICLSILLVCLLFVVSLAPFLSVLDIKSLSADDLLVARLNVRNDSGAFAENVIPPMSPPDIPDPELRNWTTTSIPQYIHRLWESGDEKVPVPWTQAYESCRRYNPTYPQYVWTDESALLLIQTHFAWFVPSYTESLLPSQRADAFRYFVLWHYGGIYLDPEVGCQRPIDPLLSGVKALAPQSWPYGIGNGLLASVPSHPFIVQVARTIEEHASAGFTERVMGLFLSGPMLVSHALAAWLRSGKGNPELTVLPPEVFDQGEHAFFVRNQWGAGGGSVTRMVTDNWVGWLFACVALTITVALALGVWVRPRIRRQGQKRGLHV